MTSPDGQWPPYTKKMDYKLMEYRIARPGEPIDYAEPFGGDAKTAVALGNFDGVHLGHQKLLAALREYKAEHPGARACVWTFAEHSLNVLQGRETVPYITAPGDKLGLFAAAGADLAILEDFNSVRELSAEEFVDGVLLGRLKARAAVYGFNFRFARGGSAGAEELTALLSARGVTPIMIPPVTLDGTVVSSSHIRALIAEGDMAGAARFLGRPFSINLPVTEGRHIGALLGAPTINQDFPPGHVIPRFGVYACACEAGGARRSAVANVGVKPTVSEAGRLNCETHIIGFEGSLYGERVRVEFLEYLRPEKKFDDLKGLKAQIIKDVEYAAAVLDVQL